MAARVGVSPATVQRIWSARNLKPHRVKTFKLSNDKRFEEKLIDVVGLYLNPPERDRAGDGREVPDPSFGSHAAVAADQARAGGDDDPRLQAQRDHHPVRRARRAHRLGHRPLPARNRHTEFLKFLRPIDKEVPAGLEIHLILDNYATHKHDNVKKWLAKHPRFHLHFTPTSSSWCNMVERFFGKLTDKAIRRGVFQSVPDLITAIETYLQANNDNPEPFIWTVTAEQILEKVRRGRLALDAITN